MSGEPHELIDAVKQIIGDDDERKLAVNVLHGLLYYQFVYDEDLGDHRLWRATKGSGQGLPHSGIVDDAALLMLCEYDWAIDPTVCQQNMIDGYWRFKDDAVILGRDRQRA